MLWINDIVIWQTQSYANPGALIGSFSVRNLQYGPFPWKRSNPVFLFWSEARKFNICNQNSKKQQQQQDKPCACCHSSHWHYQKKLKFWMKKTNIFKCKPSEVHFTIRDSPYCHDLWPISVTALVLPRLVSCYGLTFNSPPPVIVFWWTIY